MKYLIQLNDLFEEYFYFHVCGVWCGIFIKKTNLCLRKRRKGGLIKPVRQWGKEAKWTPSSPYLLKTEADPIWGPGGFKQSWLPQKICLVDINRYQECSWTKKKVMISIFMILIYFPWSSNLKSIPTLFFLLMSYLSPL